MSPRDQQKPKLPARLFRRGALCCPNCKSQLEGKAAACSRCGFHFGLLDQQMTGPGPSFSPLMDFTGIATAAQNDIETHAARIRKSFPQVSPAVCFVNCPEGIPPQMLACWILNHSPVNENEDPTWRALLLIDPQRKQHSFSCGYQLETFIAREEIEALMDHAGESFYLEEWHAGAIKFLNGFFDLLRSSCEFAIKAEKEARSQIKI